MNRILTITAKLSIACAAAAIGASCGHRDTGVDSESVRIDNSSASTGKRAGGVSDNASFVVFSKWNGGDGDGCFVFGPSSVFTYLAYEFDGAICANGQYKFENDSTIKFGEVVCDNKFLLARLEGKRVKMFSFDGSVFFMPAEEFVDFRKRIGQRPISEALSASAFRLVSGKVDASRIIKL